MANFRIQNKADEVEIDVLTGIGEGYFFDGFSMNDARRQLQEAKGKNVTVNISSLGGDVNDALVIHDLFKSHSGTVTANIMGATASSGTVIAMGADEVRMSENALFLIHNVWTGAIGNADELRAVADDLDKFDERIINIYKAQTGKRASAIRNLMKEEKWIDSTEAKDFGFIDKVYTPTKAAASLNRKEIEASGKLPPMPENINNKIEDMELTEKFNEFYDKVKALIKGEDATKIEDIEGLHETISAFEAEIKDQSETYATAIKAVEDQHETVTAERDKLQAQVDEMTKAAEEIAEQIVNNNATIEKLTGEVESMKAGSTPTAVVDDPDPQEPNKPQESKFGKAAQALAAHLKKYEAVDKNINKK